VHIGSNPRHPWFFLTGTFNHCSLTLGAAWLLDTEMDRDDQCQDLKEAIHVTMVRDYSCWYSWPYLLQGKSSGSRINLGH
jgi:hypothetical protein